MAKKASKGACLLCKSFYTGTAWQSTFNRASRNILEIILRKRRASLSPFFISWFRVLTHLSIGCI